MAGGYEVSEHGWHLIQDIFSSHQATSRPRRDDRQMLNGILWILCSGAKWRDLPERYGPWKTVYHRFRCWRGDGTFQQVLSRLHLRLREDGLMDLWLNDDGILDVKISVDNPGWNLASVYLSSSTLSVTAETVPEPATIALLGLGLMGLGASRLSRKNG